MDLKNNIEDLRAQLVDYYGTAMAGGFPMAAMDVAGVERASDEEIIRKAQKLGLNVVYEDEEDEEE